MSKSNIFSTQNYITADGKTLPVPKGISWCIYNTEYGYMLLTVRIGGMKYQHYGKVDQLPTLIKDGCGKLLERINSGVVPGGISTVKRSDADSTYPIGISLCTVKEKFQFFKVTYPDIKKECLVRESVNVGSVDDGSMSHDVALKKAVKLRQEAIAEYTEEFKRRVEEFMKEINNV